jgi:hypothetical protein
MTRLTRLAPSAEANTSVQWARHSSPAVRDSGSLILSSRDLRRYQLKWNGLSIAEMVEITRLLASAALCCAEQQSPHNASHLDSPLYYVSLRN